MTIEEFEKALNNLLQKAEEAMQKTSAFPYELADDYMDQIVRGAIKGALSLYHPFRKNLKASKEEFLQEGFGADSEYVEGEEDELINEARDALNEFNAALESKAQKLLPGYDSSLHLGSYAHQESMKKQVAWRFNKMMERFEERTKGLDLDPDTKDYLKNKILASYLQHKNKAENGELNSWEEYNGLNSRLDPSKIQKLDSEIRKQKNLLENPNLPSALSTSFRLPQK